MAELVAKGRKTRSDAARRGVFELVDVVACTLLCASCSFVAAGGFYVAWRVQADPVLLVALPALLCAGLVHARRGAAAFFVGVALFCAVAALAVWWAVSTATGPSPLADDEGNATIYVLIIVVCALLVVLLSRTAAGCALLAVSVVLEIALVEFLYRHGYLAASLASLGCLACVVALSRMRIALEREGGVERASGAACGSMLLFSALFATFLVAVAAGLAAALVTAVDPPTGSVKLFSEQRALEVVEVEGLSEIVEAPDRDLASDQTDRKTDSNKPGEADSRAGEDAPSAPSPASVIGQTVSALFDLDVASADFDPVSHEFRGLWWLFALAAVVLAVVGAVAGKRISRRRWAASLSRLSAPDRAIALYRKLVFCLGVVGISKGEAETPDEFLARCGERIAGFFAGGDGCDSDAFSELTAQFARARYGGCDVDEQAIGPSLELYGMFASCARRHLGLMRYLRAYPRI